MRFWVFVMFFLCLTVHSAIGVEQPAYDENDYSWKHVRSKQETEVFVSETAWSRYRTFKADMVINQPLEVLVEVLLDVNGFQEWLPDCMLSKHLETHGERLDGNFVVQVKWDSLFPFKNREFVLKVVVNEDWMNKDELIVELISVDDSPIPVLKGTKRLKHFYARFHFTYIDRTHTKVSYSMLVDPDLPMLPRRVVEIQTASIPYKTLKGLEERAKDPRFLNRAKVDLM